MHKFSEFDQEHIKRVMLPGLKFQRPELGVSVYRARTVEEPLQAVHGILERGALTVCQRVKGISSHTCQAEWQETQALLIIEAWVKCKERL